MMVGILLSALLVLGSPFRPLPDEAPAASAKPRPKEQRMTKEPRPAAQATGEGVANLPFARGRRFRTLDDYLAYLEKQGAIDLPWWREIRPGIYEYVTSMPEERGAPPETAMRAELMKRFGFSK